MSTPSLNPRQTACLRLAATGITNRAVATRLRMAPGTVTNVLHSARDHLGARNTAHAVALAVVHGYITAEHLGLNTREDA